MSARKPRVKWFYQCFFKVDPSDVQHQTKCFGKAFVKVGDKVKDEVKVLRWKAALKDVANLSGGWLIDKGYVAFILQLFLIPIIMHILEHIIN